MYQLHSRLRSVTRSSSLSCAVAGCMASSFACCLSNSFIVMAMDVQPPSSNLQEKNQSKARPASLVKPYYQVKAAPHVPLALSPWILGFGFDPTTGSSCMEWSAKQSIATRLLADFFLRTSPGITLFFTIWRFASLTHFFLRLWERVCRMEDMIAELKRKREETLAMAGNGKKYVKRAELERAREQKYRFVPNSTFIPFPPSLVVKSRQSGTESALKSQRQGLGPTF